MIGDDDDEMRPGDFMGMVVAIVVAIAGLCLLIWMIAK